MDSAIISWLIIFIVLLIIEISTVSLISIWFCLGCIAAMVVTYLGFGLQAQLAVFALVSAVSMTAARPLKKRLKKKTQPTNVNALVGKTTYVTEDIDNRNNTGAIKINDVVWKAKSVDENPSIKGVKAYVEKKKEV